MGKGFFIVVLLLVVFGYWYSTQTDDKQEDLLDDGMSMYDNIKDRFGNSENNISDGDVIERMFECVVDDDCNAHIINCVDCYCDGGKCYEVI